jgi:hypothetical protein
MSVIIGENIDKFRLRVVASAVRLESKGLKGRVKASVIARDILKKNKIKPETNLVLLAEQFMKFIESQES